MSEDIKFLLGNAEYRTALFDLLIEVMAQQLVTQKLLMKVLSNHDEAIENNLHSYHASEVNLTLDDLYGKIYARYGNLPSEIKELLSERKKDK